MRSSSSGCAGGMCKMRIKAPQPIEETKAADPIADVPGDDIAAPAPMPIAIKKKKKKARR